MVVNVYKAWGNCQSRSLDSPRSLVPWNLPNRNNLPAAHSNVAKERRVAGAIHNAAPGNYHVIRLCTNGARSSNLKDGKAHAFKLSHSQGVKGTMST